MRPHRFPLKRIVGPTLPPQNWEKVMDAIKEGQVQEPDQSKVDHAWNLLTETAEEEIVQNLGLVEAGDNYRGRQRGPHFNVKPALGWKGTQRQGATTRRGYAARVVSDRIGEILKGYWVIRREGMTKDLSGLREHVKRLCSFVAKFIRSQDMSSWEQSWAYRSSCL